MMRFAHSVFTVCNGAVVHLFNSKFLSTYYVPGTVHDAGVWQGTQRPRPHVRETSVPWEATLSRNLGVQ